MSAPILSLSDVCFDYGGSRVLEDVSFNMVSGDFLAVIGPNGGGKSTLIKLIMGALRPRSGTLRVFETTAEMGRLNVGYLPQLQTLDMAYPITAVEIVEMARLQGRWWKRLTQKDTQDALNALDQVGILHLADRPLSTLSGGERQRVFIARAIINRPKLLILDEPATSVDVKAENSLYQLLQSLHTQMSILMISHDLVAVSRLVNKIACLNRRLVFHNDSQLHQHDLESIYGCPVALIAHDVPHHILGQHD